jgi:hypothetical protein
VPEQARVTWTDERLDDLSRRMDQGFARVDADLRSLGERIDAQGASLNGRIDALQHTMLTMMHAVLALTVTTLLGFAGLIVTQL